MTKWEKKVVDFIYKEKLTIVIFIITVLAFLLRDSMLEFTSGDYNNFLSKWFEKINEYGGLASLKESIGDYSPPYMFILTLLSYLPVDTLISVKVVSILFDYLLAATAGLIVFHLLGKEEKRGTIAGISVYGIILLSPLVSLNSSFWGQCESIYAAFCLLCILYIIKERFFMAFIFYGLAFAFKLQAIFLLPALLIYYFFSKKFSIKYFLLIPCMYFIASLPSIIAGRSIVDIATVYLDQTKTYESTIVKNYHNFTLLFKNGDVELLSKSMIYFAFIVLAAGCIVFLFTKFKPSMVDVVGVGIWSVWTCVMFLPHMHDRYGYLLEILIIIYAVLKPKYWFYAVGVNIVTILSYIAYLTSYRPIDEGLVSVIHLVLFIMFSIQHTKNLFKRNPEVFDVKQTN